MVKSSLLLTILAASALWCSGVKAGDNADPAYIRDWLVCGPFPGRPLTANERKRIAATGYRFAGRVRGGFFVDYLKSAGGEAAVRPTEGAVVKHSDGASVKWRKYASLTGEVSYGDFLGVPYREPEPWPYHFAVLYGYTTIHSDTDRKTFLEIGTDDSGKAYLNGNLVHSAHVIHGTNNRDFVPVELKKGVNTLLIKVEDCGGPGGFIARMVNQTPKNLAKISTDEEGFQKKRGRLRDFLTKRGYDWTQTMTPKGDLFVYRVYARDHAKAREALRKAIDAGEVQATLVE